MDEDDVEIYDRPNSNCEEILHTSEFVGKWCMLSLGNVSGMSDKDVVAAVTSEQVSWWRG